MALITLIMFSLDNGTLLQSTFGYDKSMISGDK